MNLKAIGLKCDHCTYKDMTVESKDYKNNINKLCPKCGNSLLTQEDYDYFCKVEKWVNRLNMLRWLNPFHYWRLVFGDKRPMFKIPLEGHVPNIRENKTIFKNEDSNNRS